MASGRTWCPLRHRWCRWRWWRAASGAQSPAGGRDCGGGEDETYVDPDALVVVTEWKEFRSPDFDALLRHLKQPVIFDGRNLYEPDVVRAAGFEHVSMGRR